MQNSLKKIRVSFPHFRSNSGEGEGEAEALYYNSVDQH